MVRCKDYMNYLIKSNQIDISKLSVTRCLNVYCLDGLEVGYKEIKAHCKYCAISEYIIKNTCRGVE